MTPREDLLIAEFMKEDLPFCLDRALTRTIDSFCYNPLSLVPRDAIRRCARVKYTTKTKDRWGIGSVNRSNSIGPRFDRFISLVIPDKDL